MIITRRRKFGRSECHGSCNGSESFNWHEVNLSKGTNFWLFLFLLMMLWDFPPAQEHRRSVSSSPHGPQNPPSGPATTILFILRRHLWSPSSPWKLQVVEESRSEPRPRCWAKRLGSVTQNLLLPSIWFWFDIHVVQTWKSLKTPVPPP